MKLRYLSATVAALAISTAIMPRIADAEDLRIGFINTLTGGGAIVGKEQLRGFQLGLEDQGWKKDGDKLGGAPMKLFIGDDQQKPQIGLQVAREFLQSDKVHIIAGIFWSNVLLPVQRAVTRAKRLLVITNAGAAPTAGRRCSRYIVNTGQNNDQLAEATGALMAKDGVKEIYIIAPNYQAGKDMIAGAKRTYKGKVKGETLFKLGQKDFQAEITRVRAASPEAVFVFAPGGMGIAFVKQWAAAKLTGIKLYTVATVDHLSLTGLGTTAVDTYHSNFWDPNAVFPANKRFVKGFMAKYKRYPSTWAAAAYDAPGLIAAAVKKVGGKFGDLEALARAMRHVEYESVRGPFKFNVNGVPIHNYYKRTVVLGADGKATIRTDGTVFKDYKDAYWQQCPKQERL